MIGVYDMQQELAKTLLSTIMNWDGENVETHLGRLEDMAELKYDSYQQYQPGSRFIENLAIWLNQFKTSEEKDTAFSFLMNQLIFISPSEMNHLIGMVYPDIIVPELKRQSHIYGTQLGITSKEDRKNIFELLTKEALYLGLSDGARTDVFRRVTPTLVHDQVCLSYELPDIKIDDICGKIEEEVTKLNSGDRLADFSHSPLIKNIFLLDDFSASGISFIRKDPETNEWGGKINKLLKSIENYEKTSMALSKANITIILYLATAKAKAHIETLSKELFSGRDIEISVHTVQEVRSYTPTEDEVTLLKTYYSDSIEDSHYSKGNRDNPYLGFDECSLPLVLYHNTPNNSFPILWSTEKAVFPRVTRHKDV